MKTRNYDRNFILVVLGQVVSILGSSVLRFALDLYVLDITGRADIFAAVLAVSSVPVILFSPVGGAIADRFNRRDLMVIFDFSSSFVVLLLIVLFLSGNASVIWIAAVMTVLSVISSMYQPAVQASIPVLVKKEGLAQANGIVNGVGALSGLLGPVLGGALYGILGIRSLVVISCVAFALSAIMEIFIRIPFTKPEQSRHIIPTIWDDMKSGMSFIVREKPLVFRTILLAAVLNLFLSAFMIVGGPYVLRITMQSSEMMYGAAMALMQLAGIIGALGIGVFSKKMKMHTLYRWILAMAVLLIPMALALTGTVLGLGYWPSFIPFVLFGMVIMLLATVISVYVITEVQRETPNELLGKIMAIIMAVSQCAMPVGQLLYGAAFEVFSSRVYVPVIIAALCTAGVAFAAKSMLRPVQAYKKETAAEAE